MNSVITATRPVSITKTMRAYLALTKPRIIELLLITTVPAMVVANQAIPSPLKIVYTVLGGTLAAGGANAVNMWFDRDIDAMMKRTQNRPLVTGEVSPSGALMFAIALEAVSFLLLWSSVNLLSAILALSAALFYVFIYTMWLKRSSSSNIVIGGAAGAVPVLVGWAAVTDRLDLAPVLMFAIIFLWTPPHFWALAFRYKEDYANAKVPMLPAVATFRKTANQILIYSVLLTGVSLLLGPVAHLGLIYDSAALLLGIGFIYYAIKLRQSESPKVAMRVFSYSISYLTMLFVAMGVDVVVRHP
ncbi:MAG: protoheme IX farnesyltransferase [Acidimicrobiaceae bacterium]|nr:protoheme IX farnesyltransferase [Acidimicrobiaceae bacterium]